MRLHHFRSVINFTLMTGTEFHHRIDVENGPQQHYRHTKGHYSNYRASPGRRKTRQDVPQHFFSRGLATTAGQGNDFKFRILLTAISTQQSQCRADGYLLPPAGKLSASTEWLTNGNFTALSGHLSNKVVRVKTLAFRGAQEKHHLLLHHVNQSKSA